MVIDERIVFRFPASLMGEKDRSKKVWTRRAVLRALWSLRLDYLLRDGVDILNLLEMTDCAEITIHADVDAKVLSEEELKLARRVHKERWAKMQKGVEHEEE